MTATPEVPAGLDPRPSIVDTADGSGGAAVRGTRCTACAYPSLEPVTRCPVCGGPSRDVLFPGRGTVFSSTVLHIPVGDIEPPTALLYVDLDDGPRLLGHGTAAAPPGARVVLCGRTGRGDALFEVTP